MPIREIISSSNRYIKEYRRLAGNRKYRRAAGKLAVEGPNAVKEALSAGLAPEVVFFTRNFIDDGGTAILSCLPGGPGSTWLTLRFLQGWLIPKLPRK